MCIKIVKLDEVAKVAERYKIPNRAAAALSTATLVAYNMVSPDNTRNIVDPNKIRRCRKEIRDKHRHNISFEGISALYFDGRGDTTLSYENGRFNKAKEEHISLCKSRIPIILVILLSQINSRKHLQNASITLSLKNQCRLRKLMQ